MNTMLNLIIDGKTDKDEKILLQKKLKTLKDAYIKEREAKQIFEKQVNEMKKKIDTMDLVNGEKVHINIDIYINFTSRKLN